jgi:hypothetical protein
MSYTTRERFPSILKSPEEEMEIEYLVDIQDVPFIKRWTKIKNFSYIEINLFPEGKKTVYAVFSKVNFSRAIATVEGIETACNQSIRIYLEPRQKFREEINFPR